MAYNENDNTYNYRSDNYTFDKITFNDWAQHSSTFTGPYVTQGQIPVSSFTVKMDEMHWAEIPGKEEIGALTAFLIARYLDGDFADNPTLRILIAKYAKSVGTDVDVDREIIMSLEKMLEDLA